MRWFLLICCLLGPCFGLSQKVDAEDVFGQSTSRAFIREKYKMKEYALAMRACREAGDRFPEANFRKTYFRICSTSQNYREGIDAFQLWYPQLGAAPTSLRNSYLRLLMLEGEFKSAEALMSRRGFLTSANHPRLMLEAALLRPNPKAVDTLIRKLELRQQPQTGLLRELQAENLSLKRRRPWVGGLFSTLLPGMGQVYAGQAGDGISALLMTGVCSFGAYRLFSKKGSGNVLAWGLAGLGASFYLSNIWGGHRAVKRYNHHIERNYRSHVEDLVRAGI